MTRRVEGDWLKDPRVVAVAAALAAGGHGAYFVGGCVRNALLGHPVEDVDVATEARPERVAALVEAVGLKAVPTGIEHGTVTVVSDGRPVEVTTFRRDVETDGRRAVVAFGSDIAEDAARRDFTMNALYALPDGTVRDPLGTGLADLKARRVRFVGAPAVRIAEDYLRILRFFRFHAWFGDPAAGPDGEALAAVTAMRDGLEGLSRERVGAETVKLLAAPDPAPAVAAMAATGVLERILPGASPRDLAVLVGLETATGVPARWQRRLAALGGGAAPGGWPGDWPDRLRLARRDARALEAIAAAGADGGRPAALAYRYGLDAARDAVLLAAAAAGVPPPEGLDAALVRGAGARMPLRAADLPGLTGPALGAALRRAEAAWVASDFRLDGEALRAAAGG